MMGPPSRVSGGMSGSGRVSGSLGNVGDFKGSLSPKTPSGLGNVSRSVMGPPDQMDQNAVSAMFLPGA